VAATDPAAKISETWTGSFSDVALMTEAAKTHIASGADVLTGSSQSVVGSIGAAKENGNVLWFGTQQDQASLAPNLVVASQQYDWTAPEFFQKGNSLVAINDTANQPTNCPRSDTFGANTCLVGLASGFKLFNVTAMFDYADFAPTHILLTADYAKNLGFDQARILREFGDNISPKTNAYQVRLDVGRAEMRRFMDWSVYFAYRYLERDAVLDAFTDSVFHQGGTDAKGWVLGAQYGLASNTWANLRWFSTDAIDGPPLSIDTLNLDLNVRF